MKEKSNGTKIILDERAKTIVEGGKGIELLNLLADMLQTEQIKRRNYLLYLGIDRELTEKLRKELSEIVSHYTDSFTMIPAHGFFKATEEKTIIIQIASRHNKIAYDCADALRKRYKQEGIGVFVEENGKYRRVINDKQ